MVIEITLLRYLLRKSLKNTFFYCHLLLFLVFRYCTVLVVRDYCCYCYCILYSFPNVENYVMKQKKGRLNRKSSINPEN